MEKKCQYTSTCNLVVNLGPGGGSVHVWPDTKENREAERTTRVSLTEAQAKAYDPGDLVKIGAKAEPEVDDAGEKDAGPTRDKQVTETRTK